MNRNKNTINSMKRYKNTVLEAIGKSNPYIKAYAIIIALLIGLKFTQLLNILSAVSYAMIIISALFTIVIFMFSGRGKISLCAFVFLFVGAVSILVNPIQAGFRPVERYLLFLLMFIGTGPLLQSQAVNDFRYLVYNYMQIIVVIITLGSFAAYVVKLPIAFGHAGFKGLTPHSMDLSPVAALASLYLLDRIKYGDVGKQKIIAVLSLICSIITMIMAASRGAILGFIVSSIFLLYAGSKKLNRMFGTMLLLTAVLTALVIINPLSMMDGIEAKFERTEIDSDLSGGRQLGLEKRFQEFKESPLFGVGFSSMKYSQVGQNGHFEPGSGWVFILSSMGVLGLVFSILMCFGSISNSYAFPKLALLSSSCLFFVIHSLIEGYILTVSNGLCLYMWLLVGLGTSKKYLSRYA